MTNDRIALLEILPMMGSMIDIQKNKPVKRASAALAQWRTYRGKTLEEIRKDLEYRTAFAKHRWARSELRKLSGKRVWQLNMSESEIDTLLWAARRESVGRTRKWEFPASKRRELERTLEAAHRLGWTTLWVGEDEERWVQVGPEGAAFRLGERLIVKDQKSWYDFGLLGGDPDEYCESVLKPWLYLANIHDVDFAALWNVDPDKVFRWLHSRKASRKALEKKLAKWAASIEMEPEWVCHDEELEALGGWHCKNPWEMASVGLRHRWCFGDRYHQRYVGEIRYGCELWFIPSPEGLLALFREPKEYREERDQWVEVKLPHNVPGDELLKGMLKDLRERAAEEALFGWAWDQADLVWDRHPDW